MSSSSSRVVSVLLSAILSLMSASASGQSLDQAGMEAKMDSYFDGERGLGLAGMIAGGASIGGAAVLYFQDDEILEGAAYPLAGFGLLELAAGSVIFFRTPGQVSDLRSELKQNPETFRKDELKRMQAVNSQFDVLTIVWIVGIAAGLGTATYGFLDDSDRAKGIGAGVAFESAILLTGDLIAAGNARDYTDALERFNPGASGSSSSTLIHVGGTF